ncbi:MAG: hypothetical protein D6734_02380 [Candidatus Schekmanbacteria bacterium]|nr:MAG: hypothetical protein D6734_02380 [Candidatus Schekmanbacteria bacterium]
MKYWKIEKIVYHNSQLTASAVRRYHQLKQAVAQIHIPLQQPTVSSVRINRQLKQVVVSVEIYPQQPMVQLKERSPAQPTASAVGTYHQLKQVVVKMIPSESLPIKLDEERLYMILLIVK